MMFPLPEVPAVAPVAIGSMKRTSQHLHYFTEKDQGPSQLGGLSVVTNKAPPSLDLRALALLASVCHVHSSGVSLRPVWIHNRLSPLCASCTVCSLSQFVRLLKHMVSISILATPSITLLCSSLRVGSRLAFNFYYF